MMMRFPLLNIAQRTANRYRCQVSGVIVKYVSISPTKTSKLYQEEGDVKNIDPNKVRTITQDKHNMFQTNLCDAMCELDKLAKTGSYLKSRQMIQTICENGIRTDQTSGYCDGSQWTPVYQKY